MNSLIADSIKSLPPLSKTISDVNIVFSNPNSSVHDLVQAIEHDPMVVANILKQANSTLHNFGHEIKTVSQAVSRFGMSMTRSIVIDTSIRKLLNVDMQPYGITSDKFADISLLQATLVMNWYKNIDIKKAEELYLAAFLQEVGKILIANCIIQEDETMSFSSEISNANNIAIVEKSFVDSTSAEVTAEVFKYWKFDRRFIEMIKYSDISANAPSDLKEYATALNIIKTIVPVNKPFSEQAINFGLRKAHDAGYDHELLEDIVDELLESL
jgi:HD-like signal output (HDOD) protein